MDVGQVLQPGETPLCAAQNTCPAVRRHLQSLPGQGGAPSLSITLSPTHGLLGPQRSTVFTVRSAAQNCFFFLPKIKLQGADMEENWLLIFLYGYCGHTHLCAFSDGGKTIVINLQVPVDSASTTLG